VNRRAFPIPIDRTANLYLTPRGHGDEVRFSRLFSDTWKALPARVRDRLARYWILRPPLVQLLYGWRADGSAIEPPTTERTFSVTTPAGHWRQTTTAGCWGRGTVLLFRCGAVDAMSDEMVRGVICHDWATCTSGRPIHPHPGRMLGNEWSGRLLRHGALTT
jgi:hypothetical protein